MLIANKTIKDAGLQGKTIAPKKKPKTNELSKGFFVIGALICLGNNFEKSKLKIKNKLINARTPKAMGEIIAIALVREACKNCVKINPTKNIEVITPKVTSKPSKIKVFFDALFFSEN